MQEKSWSKFDESVPALVLSANSQGREISLHLQILFFILIGMIKEIIGKKNGLSVLFG